VIRTVLDANVLISGLISKKGIPGKILDAWLQGKLHLFVSPQIVKELTRVLRYPRIAKRLDTGDADLLMKNLGSLAEWVKGNLVLDVLTRDPSDNIYLACAVEAECEYLVTGNREHFNEAGAEFRGTKIVSPSEFLNILMPE